MDFKELTYIVTIADEGSISRAAEKLYMAQSSLSQFLQQYEAELGSRLFYRTARGVRLTASGTALIYHAKGMMRQYHLAKSELGDIESLQGGRIEHAYSRTKKVKGKTIKFSASSGLHGKYWLDYVTNASKRVSRHRTPSPFGTMAGNMGMLHMLKKSPAVKSILLKQTGRIQTIELMQKMERLEN